MEETGVPGGNHRPTASNGKGGRGRAGGVRELGRGKGGRAGEMEGGDGSGGGIDQMY